MKNSNKVEWMFTFEGGGWNSVLSTTKDEAVQLANEKYGYLQIDQRSFMEVESNKEVYSNYLNLFN
jgi:hypothetical protein